MTDIAERLLATLGYDHSQPLLFNTGLFLVLFTLFLCVYHLVKRRKTLKMCVVIAFSLYFYYKSSAECVFILLGTCVCDYCLGLLLGKARGNWRRVIVALNVVVNIGLLAYFKYANLLLNALSSITTASFDPLDIVLPAGISFFTFRSISYMVDIYRGRLVPCRSFMEYCFFLTFFPPLLAGPVVRAVDMLPQIAANANPTKAMTSEGFFLIMAGLIKKVVIADYIGINFVDRIFENPLLYSGFENIVGAIGFFLQLYCDFSGYSDMAIGLALVLGYRFKENFQAPFKSQNPTEFWKRWHISLSSWLKDYLYIPLGGNRKGHWRTRLNLLITMTLGGLWHGASAMYIIWGAYNGLLLVIHKELRKLWRLPQKLQGIFVVKTSNIVITFALMTFGFMFFRASSVDTVINMLTQISGSLHLNVASQFIAGYWQVTLIILVGMAAHLSPRSWTERLKALYSSIPAYAQAVVLAVVLFAVVQARQAEIVPFIYLQY